MKETLKKTPIAELLAKPLVTPPKTEPVQEKPALLAPRRKIQFVIRRFGK